MDLHSQLNAVDLAVIAIILVSGGLALWRGFVRELLSVAAWVGACLVTIFMYPSLLPWMQQHIKTEITAQACTGLVLFCGSLIVLIPIGYLLSGLIRGRALTAIDRSFGFLFGLVRGVLIVCLLFFLSLWFWPEQNKEPDALANAKTRPLMVTGTDIIKSFLPKEQVKKLTEDAQVLEQKIDKSTGGLMSSSPSSTSSGADDLTNATVTPTQDSSKDVVEYLLKRPQDTQ